MKTRPIDLRELARKLRLGDFGFHEASHRLDELAQELELEERRREAMGAERIFSVHVNLTEAELAALRQAAELERVPVQRYLREASLRWSRARLRLVGDAG